MILISQKLELHLKVDIKNGQTQVAMNFISIFLTHGIIFQQFDENQIGFVIKFSMVFQCPYQ